jgi:hypothetical protein
MASKIHRLIFSHEVTQRDPKPRGTIEEWKRGRWEDKKVRKQKAEDRR